MILEFLIKEKQKRNTEPYFYQLMFRK